MSKENVVSIQSAKTAVGDRHRQSHIIRAIRDFNATIRSVQDIPDADRSVLNALAMLRTGRQKLLDQLPPESVE